MHRPMTMNRRSNVLLVLLFLLGVILPASGAATGQKWFGVSGLAVAPQGTEVYAIANRDAAVLCCDPATMEVKRRIDLPAPPTGVAVTMDGSRLIITCANPDSVILEIEAATGKILHKAEGHSMAMSPVLSPDGNLLYVCHRFNHAVSVYDRKQYKEVASIPVAREPVSAVLAKDGKHLLVSNHQHNGRADADYVAAIVSVVDLQTAKVVKELKLPNGSTSLRQISLSPDGKVACVAHVLARYHLPTTQLERGWMNSNALTLIDVDRMEIINTVLLDSIDNGAANPWATGWLPDGRTIVVTHAGTHDLSLIDWPSVQAKLAALEKGTGSSAQNYGASKVAADVPNDLAFLVGSRERIKLDVNGPRAMAIFNGKIYVAGYFNDVMEVVNPAAKPVQTTICEMNKGRQLTQVEQGEMYFNDARICFQGWQSCASCHDDDARVDGLNWDLLNDGIGNPKNTKSLLWSHQTPPVMSMGVRDTAETAVRSGIKSILFTVQPESVPQAIDVWLKTLKPQPSPHLVKGHLSASAKRGKDLFESRETHCATCHKPDLFTDLKSHVVGTHISIDKTNEGFDTPTLVELWRTAPYLHDGSAVTVRDVLTTHNSKDQHGRTSQLKPQEIDDLVEYLLSL